MTLVNETGDGWTLAGQGMAVTQMKFDQAVSLVFLTDKLETVELRIEQPLDYTSGSATVSLDPEGPPDKLAPLLRMLRQPTRHVRALKTGQLEIRFESGDAATVAPSNDYEAWSLHGPGEFVAVSKPGGGLSVWE